MSGQKITLLKDIQATDTDINLLLLGETGVGKSTFINSISTYLKFSSFKKARKENIDILIPICLNLSTGRKIYGSKDKNEKHDKGAAATQHVKIYLFPSKWNNKEFNLRIIDTPGVGDPRGLEQDNINLENVLSYLATLKKIHGICFLLKSNQTRFTKFVEYCLKEILTRLEKSACNNLIFVTTYSKASQYSPGECFDNCLEPLVADIKSKPPHVTIPLSKQNVFSLDNEAFKALLELKENKHFTKSEIDSFSKSWMISSKECERLLTYIIGLKPHDIENTISINEVKFLIEQLSTPLAEISDILQDNIRLLNRHKKKLNLENQDLDQLKKQLYIPCVDIKVTPLSQPITVCTSTKCTDIVKVNDVTYWHYRQKCHSPCFLDGIPKEMIGDPGLINCAALNFTEYCTVCDCHWKLHMHIYKTTKKIQRKTIDVNIQDAIKNKKDVGKELKSLISKINKRMQELEEESKIISKSIAKFSHFLEKHALTPINDAYSEYIKQLIQNEKHLGRMSDPATIDNLQNLLKKHENFRKIFQSSDKSKRSNIEQNRLTPKLIKKCIEELYNLKYMGPKIQELISKASSSRKKETQKNFQCVILPQIDLSNKDKQENRSEEQNFDDNQQFSKYKDFIIDGANEEAPVTSSSGSNSPSTSKKFSSLGFDQDKFLKRHDKDDDFDDDYDDDDENNDDNIDIHHNDLSDDSDNYEDNNYVCGDDTDNDDDYDYDDDDDDYDDDDDDDDDDYDDDDDDHEGRNIEDNYSDDHNYDDSDNSGDIGDTYSDDYYYNDNNDYSVSDNVEGDHYDVDVSDYNADNDNKYDTNNSDNSDIESIDNDNNTNSAYDDDHKSISSTSTAESNAWVSVKSTSRYKHVHFNVNKSDSVSSSSSSISANYTSYSSDLQDNLSCKSRSSEDSTSIYWTSTKHKTKNIC